MAPENRPRKWSLPNTDTQLSIEQIMPTKNQRTTVKPTAPKPKRKTGRPTKYTPEIGKRICELLCTTDMGLTEILDHLRQTGEADVKLTAIWQWRVANEAFAAEYARAREQQGELLHDLAQKYAREPRLGEVSKVTEKRNGEERTIIQTDNVERAKLLVQTTLKRAGQLAPKTFGENLKLTGSGDNGAIEIAVHYVDKDDAKLG